MKFSIITTTFNSEKTIQENIDSVRGQSFSDYEHIIIDGLSDDQTLNICKQNNKNLKIFSEKDNGIYHAMNKGINKSVGEIISILNSDDLYYQNDVLERVSECFEKNNADIVYGNIVYFKNENPLKNTRVWKSSKINYFLIYLGWMMPHPAVFVKKQVYNEIGLFDEKFEIASDYDFILRFLKSKKYNVIFLDKFMVKMRSGGKSDVSILGKFRNIHESCLAFKKNFGFYPFWFFITRPLIKLHQYCFIGK